MARNFTPLNLRVPVRTTWEEPWQLLQSENGPPVDLSGYEVRLLMREVEAGEPVAGTSAVVFDSTDATPFITLTPLEGRINLKVPASAVRGMSTDNTARRFAFEVELYVPEGAEPEYVVPLFKGAVAFKARVELLA